MEHTEAVLDRPALRAALREINDAAALERSALVKLACVTAAIEAADIHTHPHGRALQRILRHALEGLRPAGEPNPLAACWRKYLALKEHIIHECHAEVIAGRMGLASSSFYRVEGDALDLIIAKLKARDAALQAQAIETTIAASSALSTPGVGSLPLLAADMLIGREHELRAIESALLGTRVDGLAFVGVYGLPGVGKTELLKHSVAVAASHERFERVLWAGLGSQPNLMAVLRSWAKALGIPATQIASMHAVTELSRLVHAAARNRRMLIVLDDVWRTIDVQPLRVAGPGSVLLFSTRLPEVAHALAGDAALRIHELSLINGVDLLRSFAPRLYESHERRFEEVAQRLGGMPLALVLAGRVLRGQAALGQPGRFAHAFEQLEEKLFSPDLCDHSAAADGVDPAERSLSIVLSQLLSVLSPRHCQLRRRCCQSPILSQKPRCWWSPTSQPTRATSCCAAA
jgi:hypothetical protein